MTNKKMGRPLKNETARNKTLNLRVSEQEKSLIKETAEKVGKSQVDTIIQSIEEFSKRI